MSSPSEAEDKRENQPNFSVLQKTSTSFSLVRGTHYSGRTTQNSGRGIACQRHSEKRPSAWELSGFFGGLAPEPECESRENVRDRGKILTGTDSRIGEGTEYFPSTTFLADLRIRMI
ncbi:hypothetical protein RUM43_004470 [Polyplax serrata]|uniref:Uncharacterized protein n=1 Tax=Polyplax serrata TaxID=468196 RepID=A0AAN8XL76_POLSC